MNSRRLSLLTGILSVVLAGSGLTYTRLVEARLPGTSASGWVEIAWPYLRDGWPVGRAFSCRADTCGADVTLIVRVKNGFCDCTRGVADDDEVDRVGDVDLVDERFTPVAASAPRRVAGVGGRERIYRTDGSGAFVATLAAGRDCNARVATLVSKSPLTSRETEVAAAFLDHPDVTHWIETR